MKQPWPCLFWANFRMKKALTFLSPPFRLIDGSSPWDLAIFKTKYLTSNIYSRQLIENILALSLCLLCMCVRALWVPSWAWPLPCSVQLHWVHLLFPSPDKWTTGSRGARYAGEAGCRKFMAVPCHSDPLQMSLPAGVMDGVGLLRPSLVNSEGHPGQPILPLERDPAGMLI